METALQLHPVRQEIIPLPTQHPINITQPLRTNKTTPFIEANTKEVSLRHLQSDCVVPVFSKDNEVTISHPAFVETIVGFRADLERFLVERRKGCRSAHRRS